MIQPGNKNIFFNPRKHILFCFVFSFLALFTGGIIYMLLRPSEAEFFNWLSFTGIEKWIHLVRIKTGLLKQYFPEWFVYSLPDGLWAFAYSLIIITIWTNSKSKLKYLWLTSIPVLVLGFEILQYTGILKGTFSTGDILFGILGMTGGYIIGVKLLKSYSYEKNQN